MCGVDPKMKRSYSIRNGFSSQYAAILLGKYQIQVRSARGKNIFVGICFEYLKTYMNVTSLCQIHENRKI